MQRNYPRKPKVKMGSNYKKGPVHLRPKAGYLGFGVDIPGITTPLTPAMLPPIPGYVTQDECAVNIANTVEQGKKSRNTTAAYVATAALVVGLMFGRMTAKR